MKITHYEPSDSKQERLKENERFCKEIEKAVKEELLQNLKQFLAKTNILESEDIKLIIEISSIAASKTLKEFGDSMVPYGRGLKHL